MPPVPTFNFRPRAKPLILELAGKEYSFDVSPGNRSYLLKVLALQREAVGMLEVFSSGKELDLATVTELFDQIIAKEKALIEILTPGKWDELFAASGEDIVAMTELIKFVVTELRTGAVEARLAEIEPAAGKPGESI